MERARILTGLVLTLAAATAAAAPSDTPRVPPAPESSSAVYSLTFQLSSATPLPAGVSLVCRARILPAIPGGDSRNSQPAVAARSATGNQCALELPYSWFGNAIPAAMLDYEIDAVASSGAVLQILARNSVQLPPPAAGTLVRLNLQP